MNKVMQSAFHVCVQFEDRRSGFTVMRDFTVEQEKRLDGSISIPQIKDEVGRRLRSEGISESFCVLNIQPLERDLASQLVGDKNYRFYYFIAGYHCHRSNWGFFDLTLGLTNVIKTALDVRNVREFVTDAVEAQGGIKLTKPVALLSFLLTEIVEV